MCFVFHILKLFFFQNAFIPVTTKGFSYVSTTVWLHHTDINEMREKKATRKLHKDAACRFKYIQKATPFETAAARPLTTHLTKNLNKTTKSYWELPVK